jgi:hypothetical protein
LIFQIIVQAAKTVNISERRKIMDIKSLIKGMTAGAAVGLACYAFTSASPMKKHSLKRDAARTMKAAESLIQDITSVFTA